MHVVIFSSAFSFCLRSLEPHVATRRDLPSSSGAKTSIFEFGDTMFGQESSGTYGFVAFATIGALLGSVLLLTAASFSPPSVLGLLLALATWVLSGLATFVYAGSKAFKARGLRASNSTIAVGPGWYFELVGWILACVIVVMNRQLQTKQYAKTRKEQQPSARM